jgi:hypothetical protein
LFGSFVQGKWGALGDRIVAIEQKIDRRHPKIRLERLFNFSHESTATTLGAIVETFGNYPQYPSTKTKGA